MEEGDTFHQAEAGGNLRLAEEVGHPRPVVEAETRCPLEAGTASQRDRAEDQAKAVDLVKTEILTPFQVEEVVQRMPVQEVAVGQAQKLPMARLPSAES